MNNDSNNPGLSNVEKIDMEEYTKQELDMIECEFCQRGSTSYTTDKINSKSLCDECHAYEYLHGSSAIPDKQKSYGKHDNILVCEVCQKESIKYTKGKLSGKSLCKSCYHYEWKHSKNPEQRYYKKHKDNILACEFCQKESIRYTTGKISGKSLCGACYDYERLHGSLVRQDKRKRKHNNDILVCEGCQEDSTKYKKGKLSGKLLCSPCYMKEYRKQNKII
jgi:formylmethanofuran dehydrogenase subunit E